MSAHDNATPPKPAKGLKRVLNAFRYSMDGLASAMRREESFKEEVWLGIVLIPLGLWLGQTPVEKVLLVGACLLILILELVNSCIEACIDYISLERHPQAKHAKDMGSALVFIGMMNWLVTWGVILLWPR